MNDHWWQTESVLEKVDGVENTQENQDLFKLIKEVSPTMAKHKPMVKSVIRSTEGAVNPQLIKTLAEIEDLV